VAVTGTSDAWIRFMAAQGEQVEISGQGGATHGVQVIETYDGSVVPRFIEIRGFYIHDIPSNCVQVKDTTDVVLRQLETTNCAGGAVELHRTAWVTLESSLIHDNHMDGWTSAVDLYLCYDGNVVRGNFIWGNFDADPRDTEGHGITMDTCEELGGALIENNVIWGNEGWCMAIYQSDGSVIRNNTCWMNGLRTPSGEISVLGHHHSIHNNILIPRDGALALNIRERNDYPIDFSTIESDANLLWASTHTVVAGWGDGHRGTVAEYQAQNPEGWGTTSIQQDPLLADPAATDFHLTAGSPAIDSGDDSNAASIDVAGGIRPYDGDGDSVAVVDMGAYEFDSPANASDAAVANPDGSHAVDGGGNGNGGSGKSGCGCRSAPTGPTSIAWLLLCIFFISLVLRRSSTRL
jgi:parallel beta-helix repeat protein